MPTMRKLVHIVRISFLFLYIAYALVPVHMYAVGRDQGSAPGNSRKHESRDIVWANVLFSAFVDDVEAPSSEDSVLANARKGGDVVLVKKRRALFREQFDIKPLSDVEMLPPGGLERLLLSLNFDWPKDPILRETDGCLALNSGLSPPSFSLLS